MDNFEFRLSTYNFSSHIAKLEWDPWDQPIIQLRNGQSYALTITPGQDPTRLRNISKSDWGDIARRIDTILTNKGIWQQGQAALPMERSYDNLVINGHGVSYNGQNIAHGAGANTLQDYQTMVTTVRQRLALPPGAAPVPAPLPIAGQPPLPLQPLVAPAEQQLPEPLPVAAPGVHPVGGPGIGDPDARRAVTDLVAREVGTTTRQNRNLLPRLKALVADQFRQRVNAAALQLPTVAQSGVAPDAVSQTVNALVDGICEQQFRTSLEGDIVKLLGRQSQQQIAQKVTASYRMTLQGLDDVCVKPRLAQLLEEATLRGIIVFCAKRSQGIFSKLAGQLKSAGGAGAAMAGHGTVNLAKFVVVNGLKLGGKAVLGVAKVGWRALRGRPLLGGAPDTEYPDF